MNKNNTKEEWNKYKQNELQILNSIISELGFILDSKQVHTAGERHLMSGFKLVLNAERKKDQQTVIIKASSHSDGIAEIKHEHNTRNTIKTINFAYRDLLLPEEILFTKKDKFTIYITKFIEQEKSFLEHSTKDQFFLVLRALENQEATHVTTYSHTKNIDKVFGIKRASNYVKSMQSFMTSSLSNDPENSSLETTLREASVFINSNQDTIEKYSNFLTHSDFVPHNIRVVNHDLYFLDHTSIRFGNKYESWARFINYMIIYNPELELALLDYVKKNREADEYLSLRLMRAYKIGFLLNFYTNSLTKTKNSLHELTKKRINFWSLALQSILDDKSLDATIVNNYKKERNALRTKEEIARQFALKQLF